MTPLPSSVPISPTVASPAAIVSAEGRREASASIESSAPAIVGSDAITVEIVLHDVVDFYGAEFHLVFDPRLVQVGDADETLPGVQIESGQVFAKGSGFAAQNQVDNDRGTIEYVATRLAPSRPLNGQVSVASFELLAVASRTTEIDFVLLLVADGSGEAIEVASTGAELEVKP